VSEISTQPSVFHGDFGSIVIGRCSRSWAAHIHREHQINFHLGGGDTVIVAGETRYVLSARQMNLHNPWTTHSVTVDPASPPYFATINVSSDWLRQRLDDAGALPSFQRGVADVPIELQDLVRNLMSNLLVKEQPPDRCVTQIHRLIEAVFRQHCDLPSSAYRDPVRDVVDYRIRRCLRLIESRAIGRINVDELASLAGMSRSHFYKQFKSAVGTSPLHVIDAVRISWAVHCLSTTTSSIAEIGDELGFSTPGHFTRFFSMHIGFSPREYRGRIHHLPRAGHEGGAGTPAPAYN
jgi:AraC-like DNA-binding protein